jgi:predicted NBD/HSP70 family sugar kinase
MATTYWGVDLGGTKIEGIVLDDAGQVLSRQRIATEQEYGYDHILNRIRDLVEMLAAETGLRPSRVGIGTPGAIDPPTGLLKNSNTVSLNGQPVREALEARLGVPVIMANDANCFALAETRMGCVQEVKPNARLVFGIIMGTGVGGGLVIDGKVWDGLQGIGGEWGHSFLDESGGKCYCGLTGCVETVISGPALERYYAGLAGEKRRLTDIIANRATDPHAAATVERLLHFFGKGVANLVNILDPEAIVLGGGLGKIDLLYTEGVERVRHFVFNPRLDTPILRPKLGDSAGVFGAAMLAKGGVADAAS